MSQLTEHQRRDDLDHFLRLVLCGARENANPVEDAARRLALNLVVNVGALDDAAVRGLIQFGAIARSQPLKAEDFLAGRIDGPLELTAERYTIVAAEAACFAEEDL